MAVLWGRPRRNPGLSAQSTLALRQGQGCRAVLLCIRHVFAPLGILCHPWLLLCTLHIWSSCMAELGLQGVCTVCHEAGSPSCRWAAAWKKVCGFASFKALIYSLCKSTVFCIRLLASLGPLPGLISRRLKMPFRLLSAGSGDASGQQGVNGLSQNSSGGLLWQTPEADPSAAGPSSSGQDGGLPTLPFFFGTVMWGPQLERDIVYLQQLQEVVMVLYSQGLHILPEACWFHAS